MNRTFLILALSAVLVQASSQEPALTNKLAGAKAAKAASHLSLSMPEPAVTKLLAKQGLASSSRYGCSHNWFLDYPLPDRCSLVLEFRPRKVRADGKWLHGLLYSADVTSNGFSIISITLTNRR